VKPEKCYKVSDRQRFGLEPIVLDAHAQRGKAIHFLPTEKDLANRKNKAGGSNLPLILSSRFEGPIRRHMETPEGIARLERPLQEQSRTNFNTAINEEAFKTFDAGRDKGLQMLLRSVDEY
jgi:hypothetical protein